MSHRRLRHTKTSRGNTSYAMKLLALVIYVALVSAKRSPPVKSQQIEFNERSYTPGNVITRDVCIIGGGATGTYAAMRLRDMGKTVAVIEREEALGGHTRSYKVPGTNTSVDFGVQGYSDLDVVRRFFARFDIPLVNATRDWGNIDFVDFRTGQYFPDLRLPNSTFEKYAAELQKYPYLSWTSDIPMPVPEDLAMPFGKFVEKYSLQDIVPRLAIEAQGLSDILRLPTYFIFQAVGLQFLTDLQTNILVTARRDNQELYEKARIELGTDALLSSHVVAAQRLPGPMGVKVIAITPDGTRLIKAKKLLVTIPPKMNNMFAFGLDDIESSLFSQFNSKAWYVALVSNTNLPKTTPIMNSNPLGPYNLPSLPGLAMILPTHVEGIHLVKYLSAYPIPDALVKSQIRTSVAEVATPSSEGVKKTAAEIEILAYHAHVPFELTVTSAALKNGFYHKLNAIQGHRSTWYTGGAFLSYHSGSLWNFTEALLPRIVREL